MTDFPDVKLKALVSFPANVADGVGVDVVKANGLYRFDIAYDDFAPPVSGIPDAANQTILVWNAITGTYSLAPVSLFGVGGSVPEAPTDGQLYSRRGQDASWQVSPSGGAGVTPGTNPPLMDGAVSVGVATAYSREDHRHPTDTTRAPLASPVFTGNPTIDFSPSPGDNDTSIATTAFVTTAVGTAIVAPATVIPLMDSGIGTVGTTTKYAREDHVHPSDTSRLAVADFAEGVYDNVAAIITAGTNITLTPNDTNNTLTIAASGGGAGVTDGDKTDITVSGSGATWTIDNDVVTFAKMQNASGASVLVGRGAGAGGGDFQEVTLGSNISMTGTVLNVSSGTAVLGDGDYGDIIVSSSGTVMTVDADVVTNTKLANMAAATFKANATGAPADPADINGTQATALLNTFTVGAPGLKGLVPPAATASSDGTKFLRGDGTWQTPPGTPPTGAALTKTDDTNVTLTLGGTPTTALLQATSITVGWTGDLAFSRLTQGSALSVLGVAGNATADHASIAAGSDGDVLRRSGTTVGFGQVATAGLTNLAVTTGKIADDAVTYAKIQNVVNNNRLLGRISGAGGDVEEVTGVQAITLLGVRDTLTANRDYFVRTDGNDANNGLADNSGGAFLTIQKALDVVAGIDIKTFNVTINVANGTYAAGGAVTAAWVGGGVVMVIGNTTTPASCIISTSGADAFGVSSGARLAVGGFKITTTGGGSALSANSNGILSMSAVMDFGTCAVAHMVAQAGGIINTGAISYTISGGCLYHYLLQNGGMITDVANTVTLTGTPAFAAGFAFLQTCGMLIAYSQTFSGAATGPRYNVSTNAVINTNGAAATYLPGNSAGSASTGGQYA